MPFWQFHAIHLLYLTLQNQYLPKLDCPLPRTYPDIPDPSSNRFLETPILNFQIIHLSSFSSQCHLSPLQNVMSITFFRPYFRMKCDIYVRTILYNNLRTIPSTMASCKQTAQVHTISVHFQPISKISDYIRTLLPSLENYLIVWRCKALCIWIRQPSIDLKRVELGVRCREWRW